MRNGQIAGDRDSLSSKPDLGRDLEDVTATLTAALGCLGDEFKTNRLACALLKSKSEKLLCDALATRIRAVLADGHLLVVREWGRGVPGKRIDLAVLRDDIPVALIEAKVAMSFDLVVKSERRYPSKEVLEDIKKLRRVEFGERYALLFVTHNHQVPESGHDAAIPYIDGMRTHGEIDKGRIDDGFERFRQAVGDVCVCAPGRIMAGRAFGVDVSLFYWLLRVG